VINFNCNNNKKEIDKKAALQFSVFSELPIRAIKPQDWLKQDLVNQKKGLTGVLDELSYLFNV